MTTTILSFGLDIIILVALGVTIFYAVCLSRNLNKFRLHREEFNGFMAEFTRNIESAETAVHNLKQVGLTTGEPLRRKVRDAQHLSDELKMMIESAENIANRLEKASSSSSSEEGLAGEKKRPKARANEMIEEENDWFIEDIPEAPNNNEKKERKTDKLPSFLIRDHEFEGGEKKSPSKATKKTKKNDLQSQAEKELYDALQRKESSGR